MINKASSTFSDGLFSASFLIFSELDLLLPLVLLEDEELEDLESCLFKLSFDTELFDISMSSGQKNKTKQNDNTESMSIQLHLKDMPIKQRIYQSSGAVNTI